MEISTNFYRHDDASETVEINGGYLEVGEYQQRYKVNDIES